MNARITMNEEKNGLEVAFDARPDKGVLSALKNAGFRWHNARRVWYAKNTPGRLDFLRDLTGEAVSADLPPVSAVSAPKPGKVDKDFLRREYAKEWDTERMVTFCVDKVAAVAVLPSGEFIPVDKQPIETRFCFGESGYDYDEAAAAAEHARTSEDYFLRENMASFRRYLSDLEEAKDPKTGRYFLCISGLDNVSMRRAIHFYPANKVIDEYGGSAFIDELPGKVICNGEGVNRWSYRIATPEELALIEAAYKDAAAAHEKKVKSYLKRYGTSKVHAWTYWRDA